MSYQSDWLLGRVKHGLIGTFTDLPDIGLHSGVSEVVLALVPSVENWLCLSAPARAPAPQHHLMLEPVILPSLGLVVFNPDDRV